MSHTASDSAAATGKGWSLRRHLAMVAGLGAAIVLASTAAVVFLIARDQMIADHDRTWQARGESVASALEYHKAGWDLDERPEAMAVFAARSTEAAFEIWVGDVALVRSPSLAGHDLPRDVAAQPHRWRWTPMPDGRLGRTHTWPFTPVHDPDAPPAPEAVIVIVASATDLHHAITGLAWLLGWATAIGTAVSAALMAVVATRVLQPLDALSGLLAGRGPGSSQAVELANPPRELVPVVTRLNEALQRLETALEREKGFTADAAHELRTPLAALRLLLEVSLSEADPADARRHDVSEAHALTLRLQRIAESLLELARLDRGLIAPQPERVDLGAVVDEVWASMTSAASARRITYRCTGLAGRTLISDHDLLRQVLANLCDNAISHGDADTEVVITATVADAGGVTVTIANQASTAPTDLSAAGHRLWRADRARTDAGRHIGIGLSLCHRLLRVISGSLLLERQGTQVVVALSIPDLNGSGVAPGALSTPT